MPEQIQESSASYNRLLDYVGFVRRDIVFFLENTMATSEQVLTSGIRTIISRYNRYNPEFNINLVDLEWVPIRRISFRVKVTSARPTIGSSTTEFFCTSRELDESYGDPNARIRENADEENNVGIERSEQYAYTEYEKNSLPF